MAGGGFDPLQYLSGTTRPQQSGNWWDNPGTYQMGQNEGGAEALGVPQDISDLGQMGQGMMSGQTPNYYSPTMSEYSGDTSRGLASSGVGGSSAGTAALAPYTAVDQPELGVRAQAAQRMAAVQQRGTGAELASGAQDYAANQRLLQDAMARRQAQANTNQLAAEIMGTKAVVGGGQMAGNEFGMNFGNSPGSTASQLQSQGVPSYADNSGNVWAYANGQWSLYGSGGGLSAAGRPPPLAQGGSSGDEWAPAPYGGS